MVQLLWVEGICVLLSHLQDLVNQKSQDLIAKTGKKRVFSFWIYFKRTCLYALLNSQCQYILTACIGSQSTSSTWTIKAILNTLEDWQAKCFSDGFFLRKACSAGDTLQLTSRPGNYLIKKQRGCFIHTHFPSYGILPASLTLQMYSNKVICEAVFRKQNQ